MAQPSFQERDILRDKWGSAINPLIADRPVVNNYSLVSVTISPQLRAELLRGDLRAETALLNAVVEYLEGSSE